MAKSNGDARLVCVHMSRDHYLDSLRHQFEEDHQALIKLCMRLSDHTQSSVVAAKSQQLFDFKTCMVYEKDICRVLSGIRSHLDRFESKIKVLTEEDGVLWKTDASDQSTTRDGPVKDTCGDDDN